MEQAQNKPGQDGSEKSASESACERKAVRVKHQPCPHCGCLCEPKLDEADRDGINYWCPSCKQTWLHKWTEGASITDDLQAKTEQFFAENSERFKAMRSVLDGSVENLRQSFGDWLKENPELMARLPVCELGERYYQHVGDQIYRETTEHFRSLGPHQVREATEEEKNELERRLASLDERAMRQNADSHWPNGEAPGCYLLFWPKHWERRTLDGWRAVEWSLANKTPSGIVHLYDPSGAVSAWIKKESGRLVLCDRIGRGNYNYAGARDYPPSIDQWFIDQVELRESIEKTRAAQQLIADGNEEKFVKASPRPIAAHVRESEAKEQLGQVDDTPQPITAEMLADAKERLLNAPVPTFADHGSRYYVPPADSNYADSTESPDSRRVRMLRWATKLMWPEGSGQERLYAEEVLWLCDAWEKAAKPRPQWECDVVAQFVGIMRKGETPVMLCKRLMQETGDLVMEVQNLKREKERLEERVTVLKGLKVPPPREEPNETVDEEVERRR